MDPRAWIAIGILSSAGRSVPQRQPQFCISECPTPTDGLGELGRMQEILLASSATSAHWQFGSTAPNLGPFLP
jgi:hypothetical protein